METPGRARDPVNHQSTFDFFGTIEMLLRACHSPYITLVMNLPRRYHFSMDYKDISERIAVLTQEIRELQRMNEPYLMHSDGSHGIDRASHEQRELRLKQIKEELSRMMPKPTQREQ